MNRTYEIAERRREKLPAELKWRARREEEREAANRETDREGKEEEEEESVARDLS